MCSLGCNLAYEADPGSTSAIELEQDSKGIVDVSSTSVIYHQTLQYLTEAATSSGGGKVRPAESLERVGASARGTTPLALLSAALCPR